MWEEICGHDEIKDFLRQAAIRRQPAQAYLFAGPAGVGKKSTARTFAASLLCSQGAGTPCGVCHSCRLIAANSHPDVVWLARQGQNITVAQVRDVIQQARFAPQYGPWRLCLVDAAEDLSLPAANSMLKIIEEPPPYLVFILISDRPAALLPTVVSRCQRVNFLPLAAAVVADLLQRLGVAPERARVAARLSGGRPGRARELAAPDGLARRDQAVACVNDVWHRGMTGAWAAAECLAKQGREGTDAFLQFVLLWLRDIIVIKVGAAPERLYNADRAAEALRAAGAMDLTALLGLWARVTAVRQAVAHNGNVRLQLEALWAYWAQQRPPAAAGRSG